ncbi:hypothetical protein C5167_036911 [Papaver somniferum]|uniref:KIB1-4 beta-propeller domain-containing protein n=1 Tax=Papaver somniferum TaxID=3469 RepID=A0A4Y7I8E0_PAPSO|nr:hypothetical protein C5167_036911 [Papaver somniferum]
MPEPEIILYISKVGIHLNCGGDYLERSFGTPCTKIYYVESSDEILRSIKLFIPIGVYDEYCVTNMLISKFDFSSMTRVEVTSLDGHVLFLSGTTRLCCSAKELGYARGWVYFTQPREMSFCKYDLEDKTFMLSMPCPDLPKPWFSPNWLMIPTTLWDDDSSNTKNPTMIGMGVPNWRCTRPWHLLFYKPNLSLKHTYSKLTLVTVTRLSSVQCFSSVL